MLNFYLLDPEAKQSTPTELTLSLSEFEQLWKLWESLTHCHIFISPFDDQELTPEQCHKVLEVTQSIEDYYKPGADSEPDPEAEKMLAQLLVVWRVN